MAVWAYHSKYCILCSASNGLKEGEDTHADTMLDVLYIAIVCCSQDKDRCKEAEGVFMIELLQYWVSHNRLLMVCNQVRNNYEEV